MKQWNQTPVHGREKRREHPRRAGATLIAAVATIVVLSAMAGMLMRTGVASQQEIEAHRGQTRSRYLAEAAISDCLTELRAAVATNAPLPVAIGAPGQPEAFGSGEYWATIVNNGDDTLTIVGQGRVGSAASAIEVVVSGSGGGVFDNAIFAGNSSGDPNYTLELGGVGNQGDSVTGDIFSAGNVSLEGDAWVNGTIRAGGSIYGASGESNVTQPSLDIAAMNYASTADVDVAALFASGASYRYDAFGGYAWQLPESSYGHIFRKNPSDRTSETSSTAKDDYFLEDPYESVKVDSGSNGSNASRITLTGQGGKPGANGSDLVYFIDGNLWLHNKKTYSFELSHASDEEARVTFVVRGNIYFADNMFLKDPDNDGIAFIAIVDENEEDSGNIYFGDPEFGTLDVMNAYMFAENNFYDYNLDAAGSAQVTVNGNMTAGNQVDINRDWGDQHSRLTVNFDDRVATGALVLPGLPSSTGGGGEYAVLSWRQVPTN